MKTVKYVSLQITKSIYALKTGFQTLPFFVR